MILRQSDYKMLYIGQPGEAVRTRNTDCNQVVTRFVRYLIIRAILSYRKANDYLSLCGGDIRKQSASS